MADAKISELTAAAAALGADEVPVNEAGTTKKVTITQVGTLLVGAHEAAGDPHTGYRLESADHSHISAGLQGGLLAVIGAKAYATATQSISATTETAVTYDSEEYDTNTFHSNVSNTSRFTIPSGLAGKYLCIVAGNIPNIGTTIDFKINGTTYLRGTGSGSAAGNRNSTSGIAVLAVADYVEAIVYAPSGTTIGHASELQSQMTMVIQFLGT